MSGLKSVYIDRTGDWVRSENNTGKFYLKSEADKVIANRDYEIEELKKSIGKLLKAKTEQVIDEVLQRCLIYGEGFVPVEHAMRLVADIRLQKYKRCLAMARWCNRMFSITFGKERYWQKWNHRWLELAEKFKPNKE